MQESHAISRQSSEWRFSILRSTEENHMTEEMTFYGPYAHIRKTLDYTYHKNYNKKRQRLQNGIIDKILDAVKITDVNGDVCTTPTKPWIVFTAGGMGAGKTYTITSLVNRGRFPLLAFVRVDPDEIRRRLPEFNFYVEQCASTAGELTRKESGYIVEILTLAALQAGKNVLVDGSLRDSDWYIRYFKQLRRDYSSLQIALLHVTAPREAVIQRAADRAKKTGREVPQETLLMALEQVPKSVLKLSPLTDYFCELSNNPGARDIQIVTEGESWDRFQNQWLQTCAWVPGKRKKNLKQLQRKEEPLYPSTSAEDIRSSVSSHRSRRASLDALEAVGAFSKPALHRSFRRTDSTEINHKSDDLNFYGPYSHIRKTLDYTYHHNYKKERQWLQDDIIADSLRKVKIIETPTEPWIVFMAGAMGAGKSFTITRLVEQNKFPLLAFRIVDPDEIQRHFPEYDMMVHHSSEMAGELMRKEAGYIAEILQLATLQAGENVLVDGSLRNADRYEIYFRRLRSEYPNARIAIIHVTAPREVVFQRASDRSLQTGCIVPENILEEVLEQVPKSVEILAPLADYFCEIENPCNAEDIKLATKGETWDSFKTQWQQTCAVGCET